MVRCWVQVQCSLLAAYKFEIIIYKCENNWVSEASPSYTILIKILVYKYCICVKHVVWCYVCREMMRGQGFGAEMSIRKSNLNYS